MLVPGSRLTSRSFTFSKRSTCKAFVCKGDCVLMIEDMIALRKGQNTVLLFFRQVMIGTKTFLDILEL